MNGYSPNFIIVFRSSVGYRPRIFSGDSAVSNAPTTQTNSKGDVLYVWRPTFPSVFVNFRSVPLKQTSRRAAVRGWRIKTRTFSNECKHKRFNALESSAVFFVWSSWVSDQPNVLGVSTTYQGRGGDALLVRLQIENSPDSPYGFPRRLLLRYIWNLTRTLKNTSKDVPKQKQKAVSKTIPPHEPLGVGYGLYATHTEAPHKLAVCLVVYLLICWLDGHALFHTIRTHSLVMTCE